MAQLYVEVSPVSRSVPFDNSTGKGFVGSDVQTALEELRDHTIFDSTTTVTTAAGTQTLTSVNTNLQYYTGSAAGYAVQMPSATTLSLAAYYQLINTSTQTIQVKDGSGANLFVLGQNSIGFLYLQLNGTAAGTWVYYQTGISVASGIINYNTTSSTTFSTSSATDVQITGFSVTPQAGTYAVWVSAAASAAGSGVDCTASIYKGASAVADSVRTNTSTSGNHNFMVSTQTVIQLDGSTAASVYIRASSTMTVTNRSLLLVRLGT